MTCLWTVSFDSLTCGHEVADAALVVELLGLPACPLVAQDDSQAPGEKRSLAQTLGQRRRRELGLLEDVRVGKKGDDRAGLVLLGDPDRLHVPRGLAPCELLPVDLAVPPDLRDEPLGERVHDRDADTVQTAGDLVPLASELASGVELRQDDGQRRKSLVGDDVHRNAGARVADGHGVVRMDGHVDEVVSIRERLVDGVVDHLVDEVMQAARARRPDVHPGS